ncbi:MAG: hypothetical protein F6K50_32465 [Moorea sp. SIO3I7]|uniref:hypothetical protein n=1 Tax=Moorena bouillonii TaxID=207920 RepID=UPI0013011DEC|nr:hypothetical protein [Moorena bouillonii]NEO00016.1 hypothetical protein [Moorena sp. SIO3I7]NEO47837.1 hypothetical protein [Moorena sp. SIO4A3]
MRSLFLFRECDALSRYANAFLIYGMRVRLAVGHATRTLIIKNSDITLLDRL